MSASTLESAAVGATVEGAVAWPPGARGAKPPVAAGRDGPDAGVLGAEGPPTFMTRSSDRR
jgi:hypothetical protein